MNYPLASNNPNKSFFHRVGYLELTAIAIGSAAIELNVTHVLPKAILTMCLGIIISGMIIATQTRWLKDKKFKKFIIKSGWLPIIGLVATVAFSLVLALHPDPAQAQFFFDAEQAIVTGITTNLAGTDGAADFPKMISLVFFILRFALVLYLGVSIVKVVGAMREDEDWKAIGKLPAVILIALTIGDYCATLITG